MRWSKQKKESGLAGVCQGKLGMELKEKGKIIASVRPACRGFNRHDIIGWYWYGEGHNTAHKPSATMELAMQEAWNTIKEERKTKENP